MRENRYTIPEAALKQYNPEFESPTGSRYLDTIVVGPPNAGKSSLINKLLHSFKHSQNSMGCELTATSSKVNTTDEVMEFYMTEGLTQISIKDTPGATKANNSIKNRRLGKTFPSKFNVTI